MPDEPKNETRIKGMEVPIIVQLGERSSTVREVTEWSPGTIIELPKRVEEELSLCVSNKQIGLGNAVKVGENFGIQLTFIGDTKTRISAATSFMLGDETQKAAGGFDQMAAGAL